MGSIPLDQKRCQLCLYNRYDLRPAKKPFNEKHHYQNKKNVTINNYPTLFKSSFGSCSLKELKLLSLAEKSNKCELNHQSSSESCDMCDANFKQNKLTEKNSRFTITRRNNPQRSSKNREPEQLSSRGVFIAVEDWTETLKRNQFSNSVSMQDNYYENLKQLDNASSNDPSYENCAMFQDLQQESVDLNSNKNEPLYALVNKKIKNLVKSNDEQNNQHKSVKNITSSGSSSVVNPKIWKNAKKELSTTSRTWMCKCSYGCNSDLSNKCDMCNSPRKVSQSVSKQIKLLTLSKDNSTENQSEPLNINNNQTNTRLVTSSSSHALDDFPNTSIKVPMASFEQDLEDDFQFLPVESPVNDYWTCKKCTLKNSVTDSVCIVCGGSKLRSTSCREDLTLRKGEFWTCSCCTLKNSLGTSVCIACKSAKHMPSIIKPPNFRPYTGSSPASTPSTPASSKPPDQISTRSQLMVTNNRATRSPSPRHDRSGAIPKRHSTGSAVLARSGSSYGSSVSTSIVVPVKPPQLPVLVKTWHCPACTFENASTSVVCEICSSTRSSNKKIIENNGLASACLEDSRLESKLMENLRQMEEAEACIKWENIIDFCTENNELFVDDSFPPAVKSLYYNPNVVTSPDNSNPVVQWRRPKDINCDGGVTTWTVFSQITPKVRG